MFCQLLATGMVGSRPGGPNRAGFRPTREFRDKLTDN